MILFFWQMLCHFLFDFSLTDVIIKVCVEDIIPHLADVIAICEMVLPHLLLIMCGYFCKWQMLLPYYMLVADGKTTFYSSIMADVMPWWLVLLPLSCKSYWLMLLPWYLVFFFCFCG